MVLSLPYTRSGFVTFFNVREFVEHIPDFTDCVVLKRLLSPKGRGLRPDIVGCYRIRMRRACKIMPLGCGVKRW